VELALEEELPVVVVHQETDLFGQIRMASQDRVGVNDLEGDRAGEADQILVPSQGCQLEIGRALLAGPEDGPLTAQLEIDLRQLEAVRRALERLEPFLTLGRRRSP
jgi:hypothetical protein